MGRTGGISSFSVLLLTAVAAVVGAACFSMLKLQYTPSDPGTNINVSYSYPGASERVVEAEVTSKIEGVLSTLPDCRSISSVSNSGSGRVSVRFDKRADMEMVRFDIASRIRNLYPSLPEGCSYPNISLNVYGERSQTAISYNVISSLPSQEIARWVENSMMYPLSIIEGVSSVDFSGATTYELVITFDADKLASLHMSATDIVSAVNGYYSEAMLGMTEMEGGSYSVALRSRSSARPEDIPIGNFGGRVVHLGDVATMRYQEAAAGSYYRINGLNTLILRVSVSSDTNLVGAVDDIKKAVAGIERSMPPEISLSVSYDYSEYINAELNKIFLRTILCLALLLASVLAVNRSWRYMLIVALTLLANLLVAVAIYYFVGLKIHIYTLAGITVSLGIIIDNSIMMVDHYSRYRNRSVYPALVSAVLTTVVALMAIFLLPEEDRSTLTDFSLVIAINLAVSLAVAWFLVPALLDYIPLGQPAAALRRPGRLRRIVRWNSRYERYIKWGSRHRWVLVLLFVVAFGLPVFLLSPDGSSGNGEEGPDRDSVWYKFRKEVSDWDWMASSFGLFHDAMSRSDFYREPVREYISIRAGMPEGCSVAQLNEVMKSMENHLAQYDEIEVFETSISSYSNGSISVYFKPEYENTAVPISVKSDIIRMAGNFGGANWSVSGFDRSYFNNNVLSTNRQYGINLSGYNYDELLSYAEVLIEHMSSNRRVQNVEIRGSRYTDIPRTEFNLHYDREALTAFGISPYAYYSALRSPLYNSLLPDLYYQGEYVPARLVSSDVDAFDLWHINHSAIEVGDRRMKLSEVGSISKDLSALSIRKENQAYTISVQLDYVGMYNPARNFINAEVEYMNSSVLPLGFKAENATRSGFYDEGENYAGLIVLVILGIYVMLAIHLNSLRYPLAIIFLVPISFVGLFLTFGLSDFVFDKGGFAAFIMLAGLTVNAGIYLIGTWLGHAGKLDARSYVKAFNSKIQPIMLTVLSSVLGLVPFLFDGPTEVFWFCFAVGTISGLLFSLLAVIFYLPAFAVPSRRK